jgi:hypothetical protein
MESKRDTAQGTPAIPREWVPVVGVGSSTLWFVTVHGVKRNVKRGETSAILDETSALFFAASRFRIPGVLFIGEHA